MGRHSAGRARPSGRARPWLVGSGILGVAALSAGVATLATSTIADGPSPADAAAESAPGAEEPAAGPVVDAAETTPAAAEPAAGPVVAAAGDIACDPASANFNDGEGTSTNCRQMSTSQMLLDDGLAAVLSLGDSVNYCGSDAAYAQSYDPSWGRLKAITHPVPGNHDYLTSGSSSGATDCDPATAGAAGYFDYFGAAAGEPGAGYYSYDIGSWHLIALNSNCRYAGGCSEGSAQYAWLGNDLETHPAGCTLAYWHIPLFSSGGRASSNSQAFWNLLYSHDVEIVLNGHDHIYERFAPQGPTGEPDLVNGIREFIVGTGGQNHTSLAATARNSEVRSASTYGVLELTLRDGGYDWQFVPEPGKTWTDSGSGVCHGLGEGGSDVTAPSAPTALRATITGSQVGLAWTASPDVDVAGYQVFRDGAQITQATVTRSTDTTAQAGATYVYSVRTVDTSGNASDPSSPATVTLPPSSPDGDTLTFTPTSDTYVRSDQGTTANGSAGTLQTDGSPGKTALARFAVTGIGSRRVTRATLRVYCTDSSPDGGTLRTVLGPWNESTVWDDAPPLGPAAASLGAVSNGQWYEVDVTPLITGDGAVDIAITSTTGNGADYASRETRQPPQLVIATSS